MCVRFNVLLEKFKDQFDDIVIISAGPSLKAMDKSRLKAFCSGKLVVCVKQTIDFIDFAPHIHLLNDCNLSRYDYKGEDILKVMVKSPSWFSYTPKYMYDVLFNIDKATCHSEGSLSVTREFEKWQNLEDRRCSWGPGIMHELGIYLPKYLNCKTAYFVGWDIGSPSTNVINRFYEGKQLQKRIKNRLINLNINFYNKFYIKCENIIRFLLFCFKFPIMLNVPGVTDNEAVLISESTNDLHDFYCSNNIECFVVSDESMMSSHFERYII